MAPRATSAATSSPDRSTFGMTHSRLLAPTSLARRAAAPPNCSTVAGVTFSASPQPRSATRVGRTLPRVCRTILLLGLAGEVLVFDSALEAAAEGLVDRLGDRRLQRVVGEDAHDQQIDGRGLCVAGIERELHRR